MIKTNEWTIADLTKYLASVRSSLTPEELNRLRQTSVFSKESSLTNNKEGSQRTRYQAKELYEPLDIYRQLGLPVIDWGKQVKWRGTSDEGMFLQ